MSTYSVEFTKTAAKSLSKLKKSNTILYKKATTLLKELMDHPRTGTGHPEPLKEGDSVTYSRHLSASDRMIYDIYETKVTVLVLSLEGHYSDK